MTLVLLAALGAVFLKGLREAVGLAVPIVAVYIGLIVVVLGWRIAARQLGCAAVTPEASSAAQRCGQ